MAAKEIENVDKNYDWLWRREYEFIPQFIPICPGAIERDSGKHQDHVPYSIIESISQARELTPVLALLAPSVNPNLADVEKRLNACQVSFQEAMMKQMQNITDQMALMIRSHQPGTYPSPVESGKHTSGMWCVQCGQSGHTRQFCRVVSNRNNRMNGGQPVQHQRG